MDGRTDPADAAPAFVEVDYIIETTVCYCGSAQEWWSPADPVTHMLPFCPEAREAYRAYLDTLPPPDPPFGVPEDRVGVLYDDGIQYRGFVAMDGVCFVPAPPSYGRPDA